MSEGGAERRMHPRYTAPYRVVISAAEARQLNTLTDDVSARGLFLATSRDLPLDRPLDLTLYLPDGKRAVRCTGRIVRRASPSEQRVGYGVQLEFAEAEVAVDYLDRINALQRGEVDIEPACFYALVVEDNEVVRTLLARSLPKLWQQRFPRGPQLAVEVAESGERALEMLTGREYRLIITDIFMPNLDGRVFLATLRRDPRWRSLPVLVISAGEVGEEVMAQDADAFMRKPLRLAELFQTVHFLLAGRPAEPAAEVAEAALPLETAVRGAAK
ncbi:MAG: response regulator [Deltaproteobacteria bacterium]|nr:response regulator [Deltaproteobacteria bacterium]